jgi:hypothetical protein
MSGAAPVPQKMPESKWLQFEGSAEPKGPIVILKPFDDGRVELAFAAKDVRLEARPAIRLGAKPVRVRMPKLEGLEPQSLGHPDCGGRPTACIGRVEFCCPEMKPIDSCAGRWYCP